ncbi:MAG: hypothetical protein V9G20_30070 [Candidatus Promineifilaceae bacterium]
MTMSTAFAGSSQKCMSHLAMIMPGVLVAVAVVMRLESAALTNRQERNRRVRGELDNLRRRRKRGDRILEEELEPVARPEDDAGRLASVGRIGWPEAVGVRRGRALDDERQACRLPPSPRPPEHGWA